METIQMKLDREIHKRLRIKAAIDGVTILELTNRIVKEFLDKEESKNDQ